MSSNIYRLYINIFKYGGRILNQFTEHNGDIVINLSNSWFCSVLRSKNDLPG